MEKEAEKKEKRGAAKWLVQFIKFNIIGISNTVVDFLIYTLLTALGLNIYVAQVAGYGCGMINSYIWNSRWTFREEKKRNAREIALFIAVNLVALGVGEGVLYLCQNVFHIESATLSKLISIPFSMGVNFVGNKLFVFNKTGAVPEETEEKPEK